MTDRDCDNGGKGQAPGGHEDTSPPTRYRKAFIRRPVSWNGPFYLKPHAGHDRVNDMGRDKHTSSNFQNIFEVILYFSSHHQAVQDKPLYAIKNSLS